MNTAVRGLFDGVGKAETSILHAFSGSIHQTHPSWPGAFRILLRNHCSPTIAAPNAATAITGLIRFITHLLNPAIFLWIAVIAGLVYLTFRTLALSYCCSAMLLRDLMFWSRLPRLLYVL